VEDIMEGLERKVKMLFLQQGEGLISNEEFVLGMMSCTFDLARMLGVDVIEMLRTSNAEDIV